MTGSLNKYESIQLKLPQKARMIYNIRVNC